MKESCLILSKPYATPVWPMQGLIRLAKASFFRKPVQQLLVGNGMKNMHVRFF
jgi:hypothetical protein